MQKLTIKKRQTREKSFQFSAQSNGFAFPCGLSVVVVIGESVVVPLVVRSADVVVGVVLSASVEVLSSVVGASDIAAFGVVGHSASSDWGSMSGRMFE